MSSTLTTPSTTSDQPFFTAGPATTTASSGGGGGNNSSSLSSFTFLATLFLLLTVSCAIILRSFIVRRRFRRRMEEAILAGAIPPSPTGGPGARRRTFGAKPRMWDTWVVPGTARASCEWADILPVSAVPTAYKPLPQTNAPPDASAPSLSPLPSLSPPSSLRRMLRFPFGSTRSPSPPPPVAPPEGSAPGVEKDGAEPRDMQVSVLIAMPDARHPHHGEVRSSGASVKGKERSLYSEMEDEDLPEMVIGVAELPYRGEGAGAGAGKAW
ncbi:hypothetical protein DENSPDRAFT_835675 [Dentipellis sp. KUC8613]|nr:hypothetical protein DENSPDRAFT_835675 [Dentipellis sp. KUC8613]